MALSSKLKADELLVLDQFELDQIKTKDFVSAINTIDAANALIIISEQNTPLELSARNVPKVKVLRLEGLNVYDILKYQKLILLQSTLVGIEGRLQP